MTKSTEKEIQKLKGKLKNLKQHSRGETQNPYIIPAAILIAGVLIAGAVLYTQGNSVSSQAASAGNAVPQQGAKPTTGGLVDNVNPPNAEDHIKGSRDALVKIIEFSDTECPFCKRFHTTMQQVMDEYGESGQVAWVYRHFPLDQLHSKARIEAAATELANELGGNEKFWAYVDRLFEITPSNDRLDLTLLPQIAEDVGLPRKPFEDLVDEDDRRGGKYADHIESDYQDAITSGGLGTPFSVIIAPNGTIFSIEGAQPYSAVRSIIELALKEK